MAHIRRHPVDTSRWQVRYIDPAGRERSKTFRRKVDAEKYLIHVEAQKQRAEWIDPQQSSTRFGDWAAEWLSTRSHLKLKTEEGYESLLRVHVLPTFANSRLDRITSVGVETWINQLRLSGLSPSRIRQAHQVLHAVMKAAVQARYLASNPAAGVSLPRQRRREQLFLDPVEVDRLAAVTPERFRALIYVFAYGGLRWGEAAALRQRRVDVLRGRLEVAESLSEARGQMVFGPTKNYRARTIVMPSFMREMLNDHIVSFGGPDPEGLVFSVPGGAPMRNSNFSRRVWKPAIRQADLPSELRVHDLRHTAVALLISRGAHPEAIKRYMGHSSITVTMDVYGHLFPSAADDLAGALDELYRQSQTDKIRTKLRVANTEDHESGSESPINRGFPEVGPVGIEPTTFGLKVRCSAD